MADPVLVGDRGIFVTNHVCGVGEVMVSAIFPFPNLNFLDRGIPSASVCVPDESRFEEPDKVLLVCQGSQATPRGVSRQKGLHGMRSSPRGGGGECRRACGRTPLKHRRRCAAGGCQDIATLLLGGILLPVMAPFILPRIREFSSYGAMPSLTLPSLQFG
jgi:hypothetical protein